MARRGQTKEAWLARWRDGACPVHGRGFLEDLEEGAEAAADARRPVRCSVEECVVRAARYAAHDDHHATFGWRAGPDDIRAVLAKAGDIAAEGEAPGPRARLVRFSYPTSTA
jgi:hypothetical protein